MSPDRIKLYVVSILALALPVFLFAFSEGSRMYAALLLPLLAIFAGFLLKKRSTPSIFKNQVLLIVAVIAVTAIMLYYLSGLYFGIGKTASYTYSGLITMALPLLIVLYSVEFTRYLVLGSECKGALFIFTLGAVLTDVALFCSPAPFKSINSFMELVGATVAPSVSLNLLFNYLTRRHGFLPAASYKLITTVYIYIIPYLPTAPSALVAAARIILPLLIYTFIRSLYENKKKRTKGRSERVGKSAVTVTVICLIGLIMLTSCRFPVGMIVIGSGSMEDELNIGDATVYTVSNGTDIEIGDIIIFKSGSSRIVHRVWDLEYTNGEYRFYTKGDANEDADPGYVTDADVIGTVKFKIPYVGLLTVWLTRTFEERREGSNV